MTDSGEEDEEPAVRAAIPGPARTRASAGRFSRCTTLRRRPGAAAPASPRQGGDDAEIERLGAGACASQLTRSGEVSLRAREPAIRPMWPPGRSKWVTSSLRTRSRSGIVFDRV